MADRIGEQLGNYRLVRLLGEGGFAEVYLGEHIYLGTQAAIKLLYMRVAQDDIGQFQQEGRMLADLIHPHIVRVLDFGIQDRQPYLVMDYAPGGSLRTRHPKGSQLSLPTVVEYVLQVSQALQYAHDRKLIHRDIKPENILIGRNGEILLSDFGIALIAQSSRYQSTKDMAGTIAYMAPEQIEAHPRSASDQYSLGIVAYEWLSGMRPFQGSFTEIAIKHAVTPPPSLLEQVPTLPPEVEQVIFRALAKKLEERFASVSAFATALAQASAEATAKASYPYVSQPSPKPAAGTQPAMQSSTVTPLNQPSPVQAKSSISVTPPASTPTQTPSLAAKQAPSSQPPLSSTSTPIPQATESASAPAGQPIGAPARPGVSSRAVQKGRGLSSNRVALLVALVLLLIASGSGLFFVINTNQQAARDTQATATANAHASATAQAIASTHINLTATAQAIASTHINLTATAVTAAQVTATAIASQNPYPPHTGTLVLNDPLSDNSQGNYWDTSSVCQFTDGAYHIVVAPGYNADCVEQATDFQNFTYQVQMKFLKPGDSIGIIFRADPRNSNSNYYYAEFYNPNDEYIMGICKVTTTADDCSHVLSSGPCPAFHYNLNQMNNVAVVVRGTQFDLYVNRQHIASASDGANTYSHGLIGMSVSDGAIDASTSADAVFTNAKVWTI